MLCLGPWLRGKHTLLLTSGPGFNHWYCYVSEVSFILATSVIHLITMVSACLLGLTWTKVTLGSLIHNINLVKPHNDDRSHIKIRITF